MITLREAARAGASGTAVHHASVVMPGPLEPVLDPEAKVGERFAVRKIRNSETAV
jgi:hypothetical protein